MGATRLIVRCRVSWIQVTDEKGYPTDGRARDRTTTVDTAEQLDAALTAACSHEGPALVHIRTDAQLV